MKRNIKLPVFYIGAVVVGVINGFFGGGGGLLSILFLKWCLGLEDKVAHSTTIIAMGIVSIPTLITYVLTIPFNMWTTILVALGTIIGSILGSLLLNKISPKLLNLLLIFIMLFSGIKMFI